MAFVQYTDESLREVVADLHASRDVLRKDLYEERESHLGFTYNPASLLLHPRIRLNAVSILMYDWAHILVCDGLCDLEAGMFFKALAENRAHISSIFEFGVYCRQFRLPIRLPTLNDVVSLSRLDANLRNKHFSSSASEFLTLYPILRRYIKNFVMVRGELPDHCLSMIRCLDVLELCHTLKASKVSPHRLKRTIEKHLDAAYAVYGRAYARPKAHYVLHLPTQLYEHGCLLSTLVNERRHRVVKRYTRDRCATQSSWEVGALEEIIAFQAHESQQSFFGVGMIDEHTPGKNTWRAIRDYFPDARLDECAISSLLRTDWATCAVGDYVFYMTDDGIKLGLLEAIVRIRDQDPQCILATFDWLCTNGEWSDWKANEGLLLIPSMDCMYSATCLTTNGEVTAFIPYFMRN